MISIVDTDALFALSNIEDALHVRANHIASSLFELGSELGLLPTVLGECAGLTATRFGKPWAQQAIDHIIQIPYFHVDVGEKMTSQALSFYRKQTSKRNTVFDCFVMSAAETYKAVCIFSFDRGYTKNGFVLAEDFIKNGKN